MIDQNTKDIILKVRSGEIDINNQSLFFSILIKGLLLKLSSELTIRNQKVPHMIINTGDDTMWLFNKGQDQSIEPLEVSNEDYVYNSIPRCIVTPGSIDLIPDQLTNPYTTCEIQLETNNNIYPISVECRRMPIKLNVDLKYYLDSFRDVLEMTQQTISKLSFIRTFPITYMGQSIMCSYKTPDSFNGEHTTELDGTTADNKTRTMDWSLEVETNFPIFSSPTAIYAGSIINLYPSLDDSDEKMYKTSGSIIPSGDSKQDIKIFM